MEILQLMQQNPENIPIWIIAIFFFFEKIGLPAMKWTGSLFSSQSKTTNNIIDSNREDARGSNAIILRLTQVAEKNSEANIANAKSAEQIALSLSKMTILLEKQADKLDKIDATTTVSHSHILSLPDTVTARVLAALLAQLKDIQATNRTTHENVRRLHENLKTVRNLVNQKGKL